ncbi:MAG TPA: tetratricopeptide repeat protein, partial [Polyangiaceae bacterium]|nr:tetratricopeptide repeat protein [Polyangiaceae bacterium]
VRRVLKVPGLAARAAAVLEQVAAGSEDPTARGAVLESLLALDAAGGELNEARQRWFMQLLECREEDPEASLAVALRGARAHPSSDELWAAAERLARRLDRPGPVADAYAAVLDGDLSSDLAEAVGRRMVEFFEEWFEDPDRVVALLKRVLELAPGADWAFDRLKLAFNGSARWGELFALYDGALARTPEEPARVVLLREAAMAAKDFAADAPRAIGYLEQLNWLVPTDGAVEGTLERLYEREGMLRALIELYTRRLDRVQPAERNDLRRRIAELWIAVGDALPAFEILNEMRTEAAVGEETYQLIERVVELDTARSSIAPGGKPRRGKQASVREVGAGLLREYYERAGRVADVARMLEIGLDFARSDRERVMRLTEIVELRLTRLDDVPGAFQNVSSLVTLEPGVADHRRLLAELAGRIDAQAPRAALLAAVAREQSAVPLRAALLQEAAAVHVDLLADPAAAIELYFELLQLAGGDRGLALVAARNLDPLLAEAGRPGEHCDVLERRAALEDDPGARRVALGAAARIAADVLQDLERAARDYRLRLADEPTDLEALDGLVEVLERAGHYSELIEALAARAQTRTDPAAARPDLVRIARLYEETLHARLPAILAWREVRTRAGRDEESFAALVPLLEAESQWSDLAELVEVEAAEAADPALQRERYRQLGEIHRNRTRRPRAAVEAFVAADDWEAAIATAADPALAPEAGLGVCRGLLELAVAAWKKDGSAATGAARAAAWAVEDLTARLRALGRHAEVGELLLGASGLPFERQRRRELRRDAACVLQDDLGDEDHALEILRDVFAEDPGDGIAFAIVPRLAALLEARALYGEVAELWEAQARARQAADDRAAGAELWARAARLWEERVGDVDRAIADHRAGAALGGEASLEALARIHHARGERHAEAEVLETLCAQSAADALSERALRLADAYVAAGERGLARARLEETVSVAVDAGPLRRRLAELYREDGDFTQLAALLASEAARTAEPRARLALLLEAARFHLDQRGEPGDAVPLLEQAVELDPEDPELRLSLSRALELGGRFDEASQILRQQIELFGARRPKNRALVHFQLARVSLAAGRRAEAIAELGAANKIDPAHPGILQALARIAFEEGQYERAKKTYSALLLLIRPAEDRDDPSRAEALLDLAEIAGKSDNPVQAAEFVESAFEAALEHPGEAARLEASLRARGRRDLLARSIEARVERARRPEDAARALADLIMLHVGEGGAGGAGAPLVPETVRTRARAIQAELERTGVTAEEPWTALGRIYDFLGDADAEVRVLERRVATWQKSGGRPADAGPLYRLAEIRLSEPDTVDEGLALLERALAAHVDPARAIAVLDAALQRNPAAEGPVELLERLARASGDDATLARALTARLSAPTADGALLREAVELAAKTGDGALEERALQRGLALALSDADASWVRLALADRAHRAGDRARAVELRIEAAELLGGDAGRAELLAAAATLRDELGLPGRAADLYRSLLASEPGDREAWEPLLAILRQLGRGDELLELIEQTVPLVDASAERTRLRLEQAGLELARGDDAGATTTLQLVLDDDPTEAQAALLLSGILERAGRTEELVALLERQLDAAKDRDDVEAVVSISLRIAGLQEEQGLLDAAFDAYRSVLDWSARSRPALEAVVRLAEVRKDPYSQADALESLLEGVAGPGAVPLAERLVSIRRELHDADGLDRALQLAFTAAPEHAAFREELIARYSEREDHLAVLDVLKRAVEVDATDSALLRRLIEAYRAAGQPDQALAMLQEVLAAEKASASLLPQRAALFGELGR